MLATAPVAASQSKRTQQSIELAIRAAIEAGVPKDQVTQLFGAGFVPQPKQWRFHAAARQCDHPDGPTKVGYGGARGGGKSVTTLAQVGADDCQRHPGLKWLLLRKVGKAAREGMEDLLRQRFPGWFKYWISSKSQLVWPNQSRILVGHFNSEKDVDAYLGLEYDGIVIEEATQLSKSKIDTILTCLRTSKADWRPRAYFTWNPGGVSHQFIKSLFVEPNRKKTESDTRFIQATVYDNAAVNPEYRKNLENLTGWLRKAWLEGDHDIAAGQFFTTWRHDVHVGSMGELPKHWPVWAAMDYGFTHPTVVYLLTKNDGSIYVVDEFFAQKRLPDQNAAGIKQMFARHGVTLERLGSFVAGDDVFANKGDQHAKTIADQYRECGIQLRRANTDRISGAAEILRLLGDQDAGSEPHLFVSSNCRRLIECIPAMQHDPHRPEDVLKVDVDDDGEGGDDCFVAGTLVETSSGPRKIETILPGDLVLTRGGWQPVKAAWRSGVNRPVIQAVFSDGTSLTGTPNHRCFVQGKSWRPLDSLRYGDILISLCRGGAFNPNQSYLTASLSADTQTQIERSTESITGLVAIGLKEAFGRSMLRFGSQFTARSLKAVIYTTLMRTRSTTRSTISSALRPQNRRESISSLIADWLKRASISIAYALWQQNGTHRMLVASGINSTVAMFSASDLLSIESVRNAAGRIKLGKPPALDSAPMLVSHDGDVGQASTISRSLASDAGHCSPAISTISSDSARDNAAVLQLVDLVEAGRSNTYALHIANHHEYFANGILVRNCYDAARYGVMAEAAYYRPRVW